MSWKSTSRLFAVAAARSPAPHSARRFTARTCLVPVAAMLGWLIATLGDNGQIMGQPGGGQGVAGRGAGADVAAVGEPYGVFAVELPWNGEAGGELPRVVVAEENGRVFYPAVEFRMTEVREEPAVPRIGRPGGVIDRIRGAIRSAGEPKLVATGIYVRGLFRGNEPLALKFGGDVQYRISLRPQPNAPLAGQQEMRRLWWASYVAGARRATAGDDAPGLLHRYLLKMLADRMDLPSAELDPPDPKKEEDDQPLQTLALLAAIEPLREQILEQVINTPGEAATADLPLPSDPQWAPTLLPALNGAPPAIEPLATRVPEECFYLRFGSFTNYVWFQEIAERYGGEIGQAVVLRGFNYEASARMERMLATQLTAVAKMFGDKLIEDMAIIGSDLYMKEGASLGALFQANNSRLLSANMDSDRRKVLAQNPDATLQTVQIADRDVSLLSTPDNRIRSFFLADGKFLFITTSETLMRRFIEVGAGQPSLADMPEFQWARTWMPGSNDYAVFGYFSNQFFHRLVSPQYQIELRRRLEAIAHLEVAAVASQVGQAEGVSPESIEKLQAAELLPAWFDVRADGARVLRAGDAWIDSLRGARGSFLPIADVQVDRVTAREAAAYDQLASYYVQQWRRMDPILIGLRRFAVDGQPNVEQVAFEGYVAPFEGDKYGWIARQLAAPSGIEMQLPADDALTLQLHMRGNSGLLAAPDDYHLFGGIKDMTPPAPEETKGLLNTLRALKAVPAYIGGWPKPGLIEQLPLGIGLAAVDYAGYSRMIGGLWRWQGSDLSLLSFNRSILDQAIPHIAPVQSDDMAQARVKLADLRGSQLAAWINTQWYQRGWRASHGNAQFLDDVQQQLKVPGEQCREVAEQILDVRLQCPLGGEYQFMPARDGDGGSWVSTAWEGARRDERGNPLPPPQYSAPWLEWFQGARVHVTQQPQSLAVVGDIQLEMLPLRVSEGESGGKSLLPPMNFDLFSLPMQLFGKGGKGAEDQPQPARRKSF